MTKADAFTFLKAQLERTTQQSKSNIAAIVKNPQLLFLFSNLTKIPMFAEAKLINFNRLYSWRKIVPCWLEPFLAYAQDTYRYLGSPVNDTIQTIMDIRNDPDMICAYSLFNSTFHAFIDSAYKTHLAPAFLAFGAPGGIITAHGKTVFDWNQSFVAYRAEILDTLKNWIDQQEGHFKRYSKELGSLLERVTHMLDEAYTLYPMVSNLQTPIPLVSVAFIHDIASDLFNMQDAMLEVC